jgi:tRNA A37 threonylcarbamoyladenosine synthetase subunit TsaC/SUA5/YrdC
VEHVEDARERAKRQIGRPSTVVDFRKQEVEIVRETPDLATLEILRRVKESG